ncbi:hypothetical protein GCM10009719_05340 [Nocardioides kribbensis]
MDPHDPVVVLLEPGELLGDVTPETLLDLAVTSGDHNFHVNLLVRARGRAVGVAQLLGTPSWGQADARGPRAPVRETGSRPRDGVRPADLVFDPTLAC